MQQVKGKISNADGSLVAPSRANIDEMIKQLSGLTNTLTSYRAQLATVQADRSKCSTKLISGPCYSANTDAQNDLNLKIKATEDNIASLKNKIATAEASFKAANDAYIANLNAISSTDPAAIKARAESEIAKAQLAASSSKNKWIVIAVIITVIIALVGFIWYKIKYKK
jgi:hypothetical protein